LLFTDVVMPGGNERSGVAEEAKRRLTETILVVEDDEALRGHTTEVLGKLVPLPDRKPRVFLRLSTL
jgi:hypothetical protein